MKTAREGFEEMFNQSATVETGVRLLQLVQQYQNDDDWFWAVEYEEKADFQDFIMWLDSRHGDTPE